MTTPHMFAEAPGTSGRSHRRKRRHRFRRAAQKMVATSTARKRACPLTSLYVGPTSQDGWIKRTVNRIPAKIIASGDLEPGRLEYWMPPLTKTTEKEPYPSEGLKELMPATTKSAEPKDRIRMAPFRAFPKKRNVFD